jgi:hypothetical protein
MRYTQPNLTWVVYEMRSLGRPKQTIVCEQTEWDAVIERDPERAFLIQGGITNEGEAERLARRGAVLVPVKQPITRVAKPKVEAVGNDSKTGQTVAMRTFWSQSRRLNLVPESPAEPSCVSEENVAARVCEASGQSLQV